MKTFIVIGALGFSIILLGFSPLSSATGLYTCAESYRSEWQSMDRLKEKMLADGWQEVRRIKEDGGCYEAYGTTAEGQRVEAYFNPITLEKLLVARRGEILFRKN